MENGDGSSAGSPSSSSGKSDRCGQLFNQLFAVTQPALQAAGRAYVSDVFRVKIRFGSMQLKNPARDVGGNCLTENYKRSKTVNPPHAPANSAAAVAVPQPQRRAAWRHDDASIVQSARAVLFFASYAQSLLR